MASSGVLIGVDGSSMGGVGPLTVQPVSAGGPMSGMVGGMASQCTLVELGKILLTAARDGDTQEVCAVIRKGAPFTTDWLGTSPLHMAAQNGHSDCCEVLLRAGISKDARTKVDKTPMHLAAQEGHSSVLELLLKHGCDKEALDMLCMTPLHWAVDRGNVGAVEVLLRYGSNANAVSKFDKTPMEISSDQGRPDIFEMLQNADSFIQIPANPMDSDAATLAATQSIMEPAATGDCSMPLLSPTSIETLTAPSDGQESEHEAIKLLEAHGITLQPEETGGGALESHLRNSNQTLTLTEAGKMILNPSPSAPKTTVRKLIVSSSGVTTTRISPLPMTTKLVKVSAPTRRLVTSEALTTIVVGSGSRRRILKVPQSQFAALQSKNIKFSSPTKGTIAAASGSPATKLTVLRVNPMTKSISHASPAIIKKIGSPNATTITLASSSPMTTGVTSIVTESANGLSHAIKREAPPTVTLDNEALLTISKAELKKMLDTAKDEYREKMEAQEREMARLRQQVEALAKGSTFISK